MPTTQTNAKVYNADFYAWCLTTAAIDRRFAHTDGRFATLEGHIGRLADNVKALSDRMDSHFRITYWILGILAAALVGLAWQLLK